MSYLNKCNDKPNLFKFGNGSKFNKIKNQIAK